MRLRRTWPQRVLILVNLLVICACIAAAWGVRAAEQTALEIPRVAFGGQVLTPVNIDAGDPVTFLLVGADSADGLDEDDPLRDGRANEDEAAGRVRADVILLMRLDPRNRTAAMVSIPRDLYVPVPGTGRSFRINTALFIDGPEKLVETVSTNFDVEINHYVEVDFAGFADVVDAIGGVYFWSDQSLRDQKSGLFLEGDGCHQLDGSQSLAYVRSRALQGQAVDGTWSLLGTASDLSRGERQQDFMILALDSVVKQGGRNPNEIRRLVDAASNAVTLDNALTPDDLVDLGNSFSDFNPDRLLQSSVPVSDAIVPPSQIETEEGEVVDFQAQGSGPGGLVVRGDATFDELWSARIGEQVLLMDESAAKPILDVIRGEGGWVVQSDIAVSVVGNDLELTSDALRYLGEREFMVTSGASVVVERTVLRFRPEDADRAELLARYLVVDPAFELVAPFDGDDGDEPDGLAEGEIELRVGRDYQGVGFLPRSELLVEAAMDSLRAAPESTSTDSTSTDSTTDVPSTSDVSATTVPTTTGQSESLGTTTSAPTTTATPALTVPVTSLPPILGRPPEGVSCP